MDKIYKFLLLLLLSSLNKLSVSSVDIKIGFYAANSRQDLLSRAFDSSIAKLNAKPANSSQPNGTTKLSSSSILKFVPISNHLVAETNSIKQTIELISSSEVNFIVAPKESCKLEPEIAAAFNVPIISHRCTPSQGQAKGMILTKPEPWKIVARVVSLLRELLAAGGGDWYPRSLVLLYFNKESNGTMKLDEPDYKIVGQKLELELNKLISSSAGSLPRLTVLNWQTNFHYMRTMNPFRQLIRRHLQRESLATESCAYPKQEQEDNKHKAAIYVVVGHSYEHLGLMLALDELNLLDNLSSSLSSSLVIGVDIEQYDERDDSISFLYGALAELRPVPRPSSMASMYRYYVGVVPAKPAHADELIQMMSSKESAKNSISSQSGQLQENQTIAVDFMRMLQFMRLPIEAFYLCDSLELIGQYFDHCINSLNLSLANCSQATRATEWFSSRKYRSHVDRTIMSSFDSEARANGLYSIISRRSGKPLNSSIAEPLDEQEFLLLPVARFLDSESIEASEEILRQSDPIWLPFWCHVTRAMNSSICLDAAKELRRGREEKQVALWSIVLPSAGALSLLIALLLRASSGWPSCCYKQSISREKPANELWFDQMDEQNFLYILRELLMIRGAELFAKTETSRWKSIELHCYMFSFPSCRFVHWLCALHQLKEMMFQYQATSSQPGKRAEWRSHFRLLLASCLGESVGRGGQLIDRRAFFRLKHKGTPSLRLLLAKYKPLNESICRLAKLEHKSVVRLKGVTLSYNSMGDKVARLVVEWPARGCLRAALADLSKNLESSSQEASSFRESLAWLLVMDLVDGLEFIHESALEFHGSLRATNVQVSSEWRVKISGFHADHMRRSLGHYEQRDPDTTTTRAGHQGHHFDRLAYLAPELASQSSRSNQLDAHSMKLADIYSFGFILYELLVGCEPWSCVCPIRCGKLVLERAKTDPNFRPPIGKLNELKFTGILKSLDLELVSQLVESCWSHSADNRPQNLGCLRQRLSSCASRMKLDQESQSTGDNLAQSIYATYTHLVETVSCKRQDDLKLAISSINRLKLLLLPQTIADRLTDDWQPQVTSFDNISVCVFRFILAPIGELKMNSKEQLDRRHSGAVQLYEQMNELLEQLDQLVGSYKQKVHLLDSQVDSSLRFMLYAGGPFTSNEPLGSRLTNDPSRCYAAGFNQSQLVASFALQLLDLVARWRREPNDWWSPQVSCAIHCGPTVGWLAGGGKLTNRFLARYVLHGATMQIAKLLETHGQAQKIQLSNEFKDQLLVRTPANENRQSYVLVRRQSRLDTKEFGQLEAHWLLNGPRLSASQSIMLETQPTFSK